MKKCSIYIFTFLLVLIITLTSIVLVNAESTDEIKDTSSSVIVMNDPVFHNDEIALDLSWSEFPDASSYRVFYKRLDRDNSWKTLTTTTDTKFTDTGHVFGMTYAYCVRPLSSSSGYLADISNIVEFEYNTSNFPKLTSVDFAKDIQGVNITWKPVKSISKYRVYYKRTDRDVFWRVLGETSETSFLDTGHVYGKTYEYSVRCISKDGEKYYSDYSNTEAIEFKPSTPVLADVSLVKKDEGVNISWDRVSGVQKYRVFYKRTDRDSDWRVLTDTSSTSFIDTGHVYGKTYEYAVRTLCIYRDEYMSDYSNSKQITFHPDTPTLNEPVFVSGQNAVDLSWNKIDGVGNYRLYFKRTDRDKDWRFLADTRNDTYRDTGHIMGKTYVYAVRCMGTVKDVPLTDLSNSVSINYSPMKMKTVENRNDLIYLEWNSVENAVRYKLSYKRAEWDTYKEFKTFDRFTTSYLDTGIVGSEYDYVIQAYDENDVPITGFNYEGDSVVYMTTVKMTDCYFYYEYLAVEWDEMPGADSYNIYYRRDDWSPSEGWAKFANTEDTVYYDSGHHSGRTYYYTVKAVDKYGRESQSFDREGISKRYLSIPYLTQCEVTSVNDKLKTGNVSLKWEKVTGANMYGIYYRRLDWSNSSWVLIDKTTDTSFEDTGCKSGLTYEYAVQCVTDDAKHTTSWYDETTITFSYDQMKINKIKLKGKGETGTVWFNWDEYDGASYYHVYYKRTDRDSSWRYLDTVEDNVYTDTGLIKNKTYLYCVAPTNSICDNMCLYGDYYQSYTYTGNEKLDINPIADIAQTEYEYWLDGKMHGYEYICDRYIDDYVEYRPRYDWCGYFACYCLKHAGVDYTTAFGKYYNLPLVSQWVVMGKANGIWHPYGDGYKPNPGDAVIWNDSAHVSIVVDVDYANEVFYDVGGNEGSYSYLYSTVNREKFSFYNSYNYSRILGYVGTSVYAE